MKPKKSKKLQAPLIKVRDNMVREAHFMSGAGCMSDRKYNRNKIKSDTRKLIADFQ